jgi:rRNA-processing protein FCF1
LKDSTPVAIKSTTSLNNVLATLETVSTTGETNTLFHTTVTDNTTTWLAQLKLAKILTKNGKLADHLFQKLVKTTNYTVYTRDGALLKMLNKVASVRMVKFFKVINVLIHKIVTFVGMNAVSNMLPVNSGTKTTVLKKINVLNELALVTTQV